MGVSIYYTVKRQLPLSTDESARLSEILKKYNNESALYESLSFYVDPATVIDKEDWLLEGSTKLSPSENMAAEVEIVCNALSECRNAIADATWHVSIDDYEVSWDKSSQSFNPNA